MRWVKSGLSISTTASGRVSTAKSAAWRTRARIAGNARHDLVQPHHRGGIERKETLQPLGRHRVAADADDLHRSPPRAILSAAISCAPSRSPDGSPQTSISVKGFSASPGISGRHADEEQAEPVGFGDHRALAQDQRARPLPPRYRQGPRRRRSARSARRSRAGPSCGPGSAWAPSPDTPRRLAVVPRRCSGRLATRATMASVPSAASTASARPSQTTAACPMSSAPMARTILNAVAMSSSFSARARCGPSGPAAQAVRARPRRRKRRARLRARRCRPPNAAARRRPSARPRSRAAPPARLWRRA